MISPLTVHIMTLLSSALFYSHSFFSGETKATGRSKSILHSLAPSMEREGLFPEDPRKSVSIDLIGPSWDTCTSLPTNPRGQEK